jgi:hypothetical protein
MAKVFALLACLMAAAGVSAFVAPAAMGECGWPTPFCGFHVLAHAWRSAARRRSGVQAAGGNACCSRCYAADIAALEAVPLLGEGKRVWFVWQSRATMRAVG